jgi:hypothetical protein
VSGLSFAWMQHGDESGLQAPDAMAWQGKARGIVTAALVSWFTDAADCKTTQSPRGEQS